MSRARHARQRRGGECLIFFLCFYRYGVGYALSFTPGIVAVARHARRAAQYKAPTCAAAMPPRAPQRRQVCVCRARAVFCYAALRAPVRRYVERRPRQARRRPSVRSRDDATPPKHSSIHLVLRGRTVRMPPNHQCHPEPTRHMGVKQKRVRAMAALH